MSVDSGVNNKPIPRSVKVGQSRSKRAGLRKPIKKSHKRREQHKVSKQFEENFQIRKTRLPNQI